MEVEQLKVLNEQEISLLLNTKDVEFRNCKIQIPVNFHKHYNNIIFDNCEIYSEIILSELHILNELRLINVYFNKEQRLTLKGSFKVNNCNINSLYFDNEEGANSDQMDSFNFYKCNIKSLQIRSFYSLHFYDCIFNFFYVAIIKSADELLISGSDIERLELSSFLDEHYRLRKLHLNALIINDLDIYNLNVQEILFRRLTLKDSVEIKATKIKKADSNSFRILKDFFLKTNNFIQAKYYHFREMKAYEKEKKPLGDWIIVYANKLSTNHGTIWSRGFIFILTFGIFLFLLYCLSLSQINFRWISFREFCFDLSEFFKYFFLFLYPVHDFEFMKEYNPTGLSYFIDVLGRVIISYGIYQTAQAFRKFGRL